LSGYPDFYWGGKSGHLASIYFGVKVAGNARPQWCERCEQRRFDSKESSTLRGEFL